MAKVGIIGGGNMGEAIIAGACEKHTVVVAELNAKRSAFLHRKYKVQTVKGVDASFLSKANVIVLATKPQDMAKLLSTIKDSGVALEKKLFVSIAAGITSAFIEKQLGKVRVVRTMPNMPALIGEGITGVAAGKKASKADLALTSRILKGIGQTLVVKEDLIDAITAVSGSGPAYVFYFAECLMKAAVSVGLNKKQAHQLVQATLLGSAHLLEKSSDDAATLRQKVTSKGGTTQAALQVLTKNKVDKIFEQALKAAKRRAKELAK